MEAKIKYLGMLGDIVQSNSETILLEDSNTVSHLLIKVNEKYKGLEKVQYRVALNHKLADDSAIICEGDEIALLPPFAGG